MNYQNNRSIDYLLDLFPMCIFCDIVQKKAPSWTIYQDDLVTAFFDYFPASNGHLLIVPNIPAQDIFDIEPDTLAHLAKVSQRIAKVYKEILGVEHINIFQNNGKHAGQEVFHYHMHLIPRAENDNIRLSWEADESLRDGYDELKEKLATNI